MITIPGSPNRWCDGVSRREFLQIGGLGAAGLALPDLFRARAHGATPPARSAGRARACILLFMGGGPPQMDTFDLKPDAPAEVRGEFPPVATSVPGTQISSLLPALAQQAHRYAIIRSVSDEYTGGATARASTWRSRATRTHASTATTFGPLLMIIPAWGRRWPGCATPGGRCRVTFGSSTCTAGRSPARGAVFLDKATILSGSSRTPTVPTSASRRS